MDRVKRTSTQKKSNERKNHLIPKVFTKGEHSQHDPYGHNPQHRHSPLNNLQHAPKLPNIPTKLIHKRTRETIRPERVLALPERNLQLYTLRLVPVPLEEIKSVFEDRGAALHTVVHPGCAVAVCIEGNGGRLPTYYGHAFQDRDVVFLGVLG